MQVLLPPGWAAPIGYANGIAVPAGKDAQGLPLGLQLIGRPFDEETLFSLGEVIEQAAGRFTPARWW